MEFQLKAKVRANKFHSGDAHDVTVKNVIYRGNYKFYLVEKDGDHFNVCGAVPVETTKAPEPPAKAEVAPVEEVVKTKKRGKQWQNR